MTPPPPNRVDKVLRILLVRKNNRENIGNFSANTPALLLPVYVVFECP